MYQHLIAATAAEHRCDLRTEAQRSRLVHLATCCKDSVWKRLRLS
jgi:hypothetical protein